MLNFKKQYSMPSPAQALPGRDQAMVVPETHYVSGHRIVEPFPDGLSKALFGLGCFWGAERLFWQKEGVYSTAVGYSAGFTRNPSYQEVCTGLTGHNEVVQVVFDEGQCSYETLVKLFFESHNPTQGMRQGNDKGTQYRSGIYCLDDQQQRVARAIKDAYQQVLLDRGVGDITTEIIPASEFYYAEDYHQQYLAKNPGGYCGLGGLGIRFEQN